MLAEVLIQLEHRRLCSHPISGGEQRARSLSVSYLLDRYVDFTQGIQITHNVGGYGLRYLLPVNLLGVFMYRTGFTGGGGARLLTTNSEKVNTPCNKLVLFWIRRPPPSCIQMPCSQTHSKEEWLLGVTYAQMSFHKALQVLGISEGERNRRG